jgi:hypothetical protein
MTFQQLHALCRSARTGVVEFAINCICLQISAAVQTLHLSSAYLTVDLDKVVVNIDAQLQEWLRGINLSRIQILLLLLARRCNSLIS